MTFLLQRIRVCDGTADAARPGFEFLTWITRGHWISILQPCSVRGPNLEWNCGGGAGVEGGQPAGRVVEEARCPLEIMAWPQCSAPRLSFHVYEKLRLCIHCVWKGGCVLPQQCQQSCSPGKDQLRRTFPGAAGSLVGEPRTHV